MSETAGLQATARLGARAQEVYAAVWLLLVGARLIGWCLKQHDGAAAASDGGHREPGGAGQDGARWLGRPEGVGHGTATASSRGMLVRMNGHIGQTLRYEVRHEEGAQPALTTLDLGRGTCRDFAFLMIDALRQLGIAARFVSGYLYDASLDDDVGPAASGMTKSPS